MTGQLTVGAGRRAEAGSHAPDLRPRRAPRTSCASATCAASAAPRCFRPTRTLEAFFAASGLGPEPFGLDPAYWRERLAATSRCLKAVLLDQTVVAGVGNIYADEALFEARLHPGRIASTPGRRRGRPAAAGRGNGAEPGDRAARLEHPRLRRRLRPARRDAERVPRLRPHRRAVPPLRRRRSSACAWPAGPRHFCPACQKSAALAAP